jgi:hypothetical protein
MNNTEALLRFNVTYDSIASFTAPPYEPVEINSLMNQAMMALISALYTQKLYDKLTEITVVEKLNLSHCTIEELGDYAYQATNLSSQFLYYINSHIFISNRTQIVTIHNEWVKCTQIERKVADYFVQSSANSQILIYPVTFISNAITPVVMTDKYTTIQQSLGYEFTYVRKPANIDLAGVATNPMCELHADFHEIIADRAAMLAKIASDEDRLKMSVKDQGAGKQQK